jgi:predicted ATP-grasp superfamily ATP-dependent carboligase
MFRPVRPSGKNVPVLLVKVGRYPHDYGGLGVVRTLGRMGVPVYAMVEDRFTPVATSRYLTGRFVRTSSGLEDPAHLVELLLDLGRSIGRPAIAVPTDDEAAVLLAEHADELTACFLLPRVSPGLPRRLASKDTLHELCRRNGVPTPRIAVPANVQELLAAGRSLGYPVVIKNREPFARLRAPAAGTSTVISNEVELRERFPSEPLPSLLLQEYVPREEAEDWITHLYCGAGGEAQVVFTGLKLRSWPPYAGFTTRADARPNPRLARQATEFCRTIKYGGIADLDWRFDRRDGQYKLLDFNPRRGAQFRLFETVGGVDVVRALYLDLTGRPVPRERQNYARQFAAGHLDLPSAVISGFRERRLPSRTAPNGTVERAWLSIDDPTPSVVEAARFTEAVAGRAVRLLCARRRRPR